jgi:hypothetical protein
MHRGQRIPRIVLVLAIMALGGAQVCSQEPPATQPSAPAEQAGPPAAALPKPLASLAKKAIDQGLGFLRRSWDAQRARASGDAPVSFGHPGIDALALLAYYRSPRNYTNDDGPFIKDLFTYLVSIQREDGAINDQEGLDNYVTSVALMALLESGEDVERIREKAVAFLTGSQLDEGEGYSPDDKHYGGQGYGSTQRPDLSNTQLAMDALHDAGLPEDHEYYAKVIRFLQRCQQHSETNDLQEIRGEDGKTYVPGDDGGFIYHPGRGEAGVVTNPDGTSSLRSYGSMTYAGFKSMLYAGLSPEDPRVQAALGWIRQNYRLDENPGAGQQGLYYYYHTFAKALIAAKIDVLTDEEGVDHSWRAELAEALLARQRDDGSWVNENGRWMEDNPVLSTCYALLALEYCLE